jgi:hypothetical protein
MVSITSRHDLRLTTTRQRQSSRGELAIFRPRLSMGVTGVVMDNGARGASEFVTSAPSDAKGNSLYSAHQVRHTLDPCGPPWGLGAALGGMGACVRWWRG